MLVMTKRGLSLGSLSGADNFGFDDDAAQAWPLPSLVANIPINMFGLPAAPGELARSPHSAFSNPLQHGILGHRDHILEFGREPKRLQGMVDKLELAGLLRHNQQSCSVFSIVHDS